MARLKNVKDIKNLLKAVKKCSGDVWLKSVDGTESFNLKSTLSQYIGIDRLIEEQGDNYEIFCDRKEDEQHLILFFKEFFDNNPDQSINFEEV